MGGKCDGYSVLLHILMMRPQFSGVHCCFINRAGVETFVISLTAGEGGSRGTATSREELAEVRRAEFAAACKILKVSYGEVLGYSDGDLYEVPPNRPIADLAYRIRRIRPQILITFGPDGGTGHADHSMASVFATHAFHWAARGDRFSEQLSTGVTLHPGAEAVLCDIGVRLSRTADTLSGADQRNPGYPRLC